jgi:hypothetical protein
MKHRRLHVLAVAAVSAVALVPDVEATRPQTTVPDAFVTIHVRITDARISLDRQSASRGDMARFVIRNVGTNLHNFTLFHARFRNGTQGGFSSTLGPRERKVRLLFLDYRGTLSYRSTIGHDRTKPGMHGIFTIR